MNTKKIIEELILKNGYKPVNPVIPFKIPTLTFNKIVMELESRGIPRQDAIHELMHRYTYCDVVAYKDKSYDFIYPDGSTVHFPPKKIITETPSLDYSYKICVIGDMMIDVWVDAVEDGECPEGRKNYTAPSYRVSAGGAGNLAEIILRLGCEVKLFGVEGDRIFKKICSLDSTYEPGRVATTKIRCDSIRISIENIDDIEDVSVNEICNKISSESWDAVVVSDYGKGNMTRNLINFIGNYCKNNNTPLFVDPKFKNWDLYLKYADVIKCNQVEYEQASFVVSDICGWIVETLGSSGYVVYREGVEPKKFIANKDSKRDAIDICGAGDVFMGVMVLEYLRTQDIYKACELANYAAGLSVTHKGTYRPSLEELAGYGR